MIKRNSLLFLILVLSKTLCISQDFRLDTQTSNDEIIKKADSIYELIRVSKAKEALAHADAIISITKDINDSIYPAKAHITKANFLGSLSKYQKAMEELAKANVYANRNSNEDQQIEIKYYIALLKTSVGEHRESKDLLKEVLKYYKAKHLEGERYKRLYIMSLYAYGNAFNILNESDSASIPNKKAIRLSLKSKDSMLYDRLLLSSAISDYNRGNYQSGLDSIKKILDVYKSKPSSMGTIMTRNLYLGKIYLEQNKPNLAEKYFLKVDSIAFTQNYFPPSVRHAYETLIKYYKDKNDTDKQLHFIDKLIKVDSILDRDALYLAKNINDEYTIPNLMLEKENIIKSLEQEGSEKVSYLFILLGCISVLAFVLLWNNKKRRLYKKRVAELEKPKKKQSAASYTIDDKTTKRILDELEALEDSDLYLNTNFNLSYLAKRLNTNTSYLSKTINKYKGKTFKQYLIELRINALIDKLDKNPMYRKYSIEALAESIGYNNASSFTRIFKNYLGESPSSFLKKRYMNKNEEH